MVKNTRNIACFYKILLYGKNLSPDLLQNIKKGAAIHPFINAFTKNIM